MANPPPKIRWAIFFAVALLALAVRLPQLGDRPMHTDEAVNAYALGELLSGSPFHYDPRDRHGPALFSLAKPVAEWCGAGNFSELDESSLRLSTVIAGTATVLMLGAGVELFGFIPSLVAALLLAFTPLPVYYSRYFIHETLFVAATLGLILSGWHAFNARAVLPAALAGFSAAVMLATKETAVIHLFALGLVAAVWAVFNLASHRAAGFPPPKIVLTAMMVFSVTTILFFTWGGRNWAGLTDLFRAFPNFAVRAAGQGHAKPFGYYFTVLGGGASGGILLGLSAVGAIRAGRSSVGVLLACYTLLVVVIYGLVPYKTPWLALNLWLPLVILVGIAGEAIWFVTPKLASRAGLVAGLVGLGFLIAHDTRQRVFLHPAAESNPYAYAQTTDDVLRLPDRLRELSRQGRLAEPRIAVVAADAWPLPWYLRKFPQVGYWQPGADTGAADFFITPPDISGQLAERLRDFRPEFFGVRPNVLLILWSPAGGSPRHE